MRRELSPMSPTHAKYRGPLKPAWIGLVPCVPCVPYRKSSWPNSCCIVGASLCYEVTWFRVTDARSKQHEAEHENGVRAMRYDRGRAFGLVERMRRTGRPDVWGWWHGHPWPYPPLPPPPIKGTSYDIRNAGHSNHVNAVATDFLER